MIHTRRVQQDLTRFPLVHRPQIPPMEVVRIYRRLRAGRQSHPQVISCSDSRERPRHIANTTPPRTRLSALEKLRHTWQDRYTRTVCNMGGSQEAHYQGQNRSTAQQEFTPYHEPHQSIHHPKTSSGDIPRAIGIYGSMLAFHKSTCYQQIVSQ